MSSGLREAPLRPPTLGEIGRVVGLSKRAVAEALHDSGGTVKVSAATRERVQAIAQSMGYRRNLAARSLTKGKTGLIGVLASVGSMHISAIHLAMVMNGFRKFGISPVVIHVAESTPSEFDAAADTLLDARVDGVLMVNGSRFCSERHTGEFRRFGMPVVQVGGSSAPPGLSHYATSRSACFKLLINHLVETGYKKLGVLFHDDSESKTSPRATPAGSATRLAILEAVNDARNAGISVDLEFFNVPTAAACDAIHPLYVPGYFGMKQILKEGKLPEALVCQVDSWALGAMRACREAGLRIPRDLALTGYSGEPVTSATYVPLTTVEEPFEEMCEAAIKELLGILREGQPAQGKTVLMPPRLLVRESTMRAAVIPKT